MKTIALLLALLATTTTVPRRRIVAHPSCTYTVRTPGGCEFVYSCDGTLLKAVCP